MHSISTQRWGSQGSPEFIKGVTASLPPANHASLAVGWPGQILKIKGQRLLQIFYGFLFGRTATFQIKIGALRDENAVFFDDDIVRVLFAFLGFHDNKYVADLKITIIRISFDFFCCYLIRLSPRPQHG